MSMLYSITSSLYERGHLYIPCHTCIPISSGVKIHVYIYEHIFVVVRLIDW